MTAVHPREKIDDGSEVYKVRKVALYKGKTNAHVDTSLDALFHVPDSSTLYAASVARSPTPAEKTRSVVTTSWSRHKASFDEVQNGDVVHGLNRHCRILIKTRNHDHVHENLCNLFDQPKLPFLFFGPEMFGYKRLRW